MSERIVIEIPGTLQHPLYFSNINTVEIEVSDYQGWNASAVENLSYELLTEGGKVCYQPWLHSEEIIPQLSKEWVQLEEELEEMFKRRAVKEAAPLMSKGIKLCIASLFWHNGKPITLKWDDLSDICASVPVNFAERMSFIMTRPGLYASYKVLSQIMIELKKMIAIDQIKRKRMQKN
ncbi:hypothetical protein IEO70_19055 [Bacillus sp. AGMB 02131]|uniref:YpoC-like domain-containing protein n=1 Tax=Peribacillus faecalis TaxID=2772559 RepID=A0A927D3I6_9BACI|nr:hypothetical protein [Peribacillus faecalis]MBD3110429.1 hypothetical protein [Peribacillus faecalis]